MSKYLKKLEELKNLGLLHVSQYGKLMNQYNKMNDTYKEARDNNADFIFSQKLMANSPNKMANDIRIIKNILIFSLIMSIIGGLIVAFSF